MNLEYFPHFMRANYPAIVGESNKDLIEIGEQFKKYLKDIFKDKLEKLESIWDISPSTVIRDLNHPFKTNGYNPVLIIHFGLFVEQQLAKDLA